MKNPRIKKSFFLLLSIAPALAFAADEDAGGLIVLNPSLGDYLIGGIGVVVIASALFVIYRLLSMMVRLKEIEIYEKHGLKEYLEEKKEGESWWKRLMKGMASNAVPVEREASILMDHNYDGIRELDNNLPPWWLYGFYASIVFSVFYMGFYHFSANAQSSQELYALEMKQAQAQVEQYLSRQADKVDESNVELLTDEASLADGKAIFAANCVTCHLESGGGSPNSVGPNLTDKYWIHGGSIKDVFKTIKYGVPEKGMISWKTQLRPVDMHKVSSYILSLQGTNPPNAKAPEGEPYEPESTGE